MNSTNIVWKVFGAVKVAMVVERLIGSQEVKGLIHLGSTITKRQKCRFLCCFLFVERSSQGS